MYFTRWRFLVLIIIPILSLLVFSSFTTTTSTLTAFNPFRRTFFVSNCTIHHSIDPDDEPSAFNSSQLSPPPNQVAPSRKEQLDQSKIAVCLVGGARKFELTGPSIVENILKEYPNADLFLHGPLDGDAFKFSFLKAAPRLASIRIFQPQPIPETPELARLLSPIGSPNGIQGLLQYFSLVEGCLTLIKAYQKEKRFTYDWIIRARADGYWNAPLDPDSFVPGQYVVPSGSVYWGLNDRHGIGDFNTSTVALSRLSILPTLVSAGLHQINSESAFKAQFTTHGMPYVTKRLPFCVLSDRRYPFPPATYSIPVAATSSPGPLSGVKCRPCSWVCQGKCVADLMTPVMKEGGWTDWENGTLQLCDPRGDVEKGWEEVFDVDAGVKLAESRKRILELRLEDCVRDFDEMRLRTTNWDVPPPEEICRLGLGTK